MQPERRTFAPGSARSLEPNHPPPGLGDDPEAWQARASDSGGLLINPEERGGGGVLAHPSQVVGAGQARQGHKVEGKLADPGGPRGWVSKGN